MKHVFILNAPKASGKDEAVKALMTIHPLGEHISFKDALFDSTAEYFGVDREWFVERHNNRNLKELPTLELPRPDMSSLTLMLCAILYLIGTIFKHKGLQSLGFLSTREALIHVSEDVYKPKYGKAYFGTKVAEKIKELQVNTNVFISDGGFVEELIPILELPDVKLIVIHLHRNGCVYDSTDSRGFVTKDDISHENLQFLQVYNNGTLDDLQKNLCFVFYDVIFDTVEELTYGENPHEIVSSSG